MSKFYKELYLQNLEHITVITKPNSVKHTFDHPDRRYTTLSDDASLVVPKGTDNPVLRSDEYYEDEEGNITVRRICLDPDNYRKVVVIYQEFNRSDILSFCDDTGFLIDFDFDCGSKEKLSEDEITHYMHHHYVEGTELKLKKDHKQKVWLGS